jgi:hypothetical protein
MYIYIHHISPVFIFNLLKSFICNTSPPPTFLTRELGPNTLF